MLSLAEVGAAGGVLLEQLASVVVSDSGLGDCPASGACTDGPLAQRLFVVAVTVQQF